MNAVHICSSSLPTSALSDVQTLLLLLLLYYYCWPWAVELARKEMKN
jgi:hypothetical protein